MNPSAATKSATMMGNRHCSGSLYDERCAMDLPKVMASESLGSGPTSVENRNFKLWIRCFVR